MLSFNSDTGDKSEGNQNCDYFNLDNIGHDNDHYLKENTNDVCFILTDVLLKILPIASRLPKERKRDMAPRLSGCRK